MSFIAGILTLILLLNSLLLILLVLVQLPKKDAGAGLAFGGGTADALFGAGSGNALTKITKWGTVAFIVIALVLGYLQDSVHRGENNSSDFLKSVGQKQMQTAVPAQPASQTLTPAPNSLPDSTPLLSTNAPAPAATATNK
jgi:preprotein translocase subunit SecG